MTLVIDGNDGTGKSTLVASLRNMGYSVLDRGVPTKMTDDMAAFSDIKDNEVYFILDASVETSRKRLALAGRDLNEKYHTVEDLTYYREKFLSVCDIIPDAILIDAEQEPAAVLECVLKHIDGME